mmetsp:Transcript_36063/g.54950  ORF Transcript_36063/g.54950 Transcript_36063/m.54950 type:complete len:84 (+) Transcript_36063:202-453(+)
MAFKAADIERKYNAKRSRDLFIIVKGNNSDRVHRLNLKRIHQKNDQTVKVVQRLIRYSDCQFVDVCCLDEIGQHRKRNAVRET